MTNHYNLIIIIMIDINHGIWNIPINIRKFLDQVIDLVKTKGCLNSSLENYNFSQGSSGEQKKMC